MPNNMEELKPTKVEENKPETINVKREAIEKLLKRIERLEYAASKAQLAHWDEKVVKDKTKEASVSVYEGKIILAWRIVEDIVEKINGIWTEKQTIELIFDNDEKETVPFVQFVKRTQRKKIKVLSETKSSDGSEIWAVETTEEGGIEPKKFSIDTKFVN